MQQSNKRTFLTLCGVTLTLLAALLLTTYGLPSSIAFAQEASAITSPASDSIVAGAVTIEGTATDASFQRYELYVKPADAGNNAYIYIGGNTNPVIAGPLGVWDTANLQPNTYDLRMRVVRIDGNYAEYLVPNLQVVPESEAPADTSTDTITDTVTDTAPLTSTPVPTTTDSPTATVALTPTTAPVNLPAAAQILVINNVNVRGGPSTDYDIVDTLVPGDSAPITGQNADGDWWQIAVEGGNGWVLGRLVTAENVDAVPVVEAPDTLPTPTAEPTLEPTAVPEATVPEPTTEPESAAETEPAVSLPSSVGVAGVGVTGVEGSGSVTLVGDTEDPATLRTFLRAMLMGISPANTMVTATMGALPATLPITLTVPQTATVIGSLVRAGDFGDTQIFLSTQGTADGLLTTLRQQLLDQDFTEPPADVSAGNSGQVFLSSEALAVSSLLCGPDNELAVSLGAMSAAGEDESVSLNLSVVSDFGSPCLGQLQSGGADVLAILPQLAPPPQAQVRSSGTGSSSGSGSLGVSAEAEIESELSAVELATQYEDQLATAGWEQVDISQTAALAWSAWSFEDENANTWSAVLYIVRQGAAEGNYLATLRAQSQP